MGVNFLRQYLFKQQKGRCHYCQIAMRKSTGSEYSVTVDHIIPKSDGGTRARNNVIGACWSCNNARGNTPYEMFKARVMTMGRPRCAPAPKGMAVKESLTRRVEKEEARLREKAIKEGNAPWTEPKSSFRKYIEQLDRHPVLADAFEKAKGPR